MRQAETSPLPAQPSKLVQALARLLLVAAKVGTGCARPANADQEARYLQACEARKATQGD
jgi:hypothetical protein